MVTSVYYYFNINIKIICMELKSKTMFSMHWAGAKDTTNILCGSLCRGFLDLGSLGDSFTQSVICKRKEQQLLAYRSCDSCFDLSLVHKKVH